MKIFCTLPFLLAACVHSSALPPSDVWQPLQRETLGLIAGTQICGPVSQKIGFCRSDRLEMPSVQEAALSDACRGQPASYLSGFGVTPTDMRDRKAASDALSDLFAKPPFEGLLGGLDDRAILKSVHDRDQALRFFRPAVPVSNPQILEQSKWVAICAHALFARQLVDRFLKRSTPQAIATDEELANYTWLLVQHSDFDPKYQLRMSHWFGSVDNQHMKQHSAYLFDRAMVGLHRPQRFGTQLRCLAGTRAPFPVEDEGGMDGRRISLGLAPMKEHLANFPRPCPPPPKN